LPQTVSYGQYDEIEESCFIVSIATRVGERKRVKEGGKGNVLDRRALNRALLERQLLLRRHTMPAADVIEHLVGMQAQNPLDPYYAAWTRLNDFDHQELSDLMTDRKAVRLAMMRSTIHLVSARDCLSFRSVLQPAQDKIFYSSSPFGRQIKDMDIDALVAAGRAIVEEKPCTLAELGKRLSERWPDLDAQSMAYGIRNYAPLVQVPPRGLWGKSGQPTLTTAEHWLGQPVADVTTPDDLILRYLGAFGPATVLDAQYWSGLTQLSDAFERLRSRLVTFRDERGKELFDLPEAPRPDPATPATPRFLPQYDNVLLGHADRSRIVTDKAQGQEFIIKNRFPGTILVDGFLSGIWKIIRERRAATMFIRLFAPISDADMHALTEEANRLLVFAEANTESREIEFLPIEGSGKLEATTAKA
jgi:Winged helix DNA-binding domain